ncbi:MAG: efflux RND transporter periplasmic adaptor subunit [Gammaproteobacteria bacterium]
MFINKLNIAPLLLIGAASALSACNSSEDRTPGTAPAAIPVAVFEARFDQRYRQRQSLTGRVEARRTSATGFELGGLLKAVQVDEGDRISAGDPLASLDTDRLQARRAEAAALADQADVQLNLAEKTLERMKEALDFRGVSQQQYDEAVNLADTARATVTATRSRLKSIDVDLNKSTLIAPFDAQITARHVDEGQVLQPGQPVLTLQEQGALNVRIGVAGRALSALKPGSAHNLSIGDQSVLATVRQRLPQRNDVSRTVDVLFDLPTSDGSIRAGDLARLSLEQSVEQSGLWLPIEALAEGQRGLWTVYIAVPAEKRVVGATHRVEPRPVEIIYQETDRAFVRGTLGDGDKVIRAGLQRIVPGQFVRLATQAQT